MVRSFGRGVDFIINDDKVIANEGVHVIQTFLSLQLSEEVQIKGRCARQGQKGSYSLILSFEDLFNEFDLKPEDIGERQDLKYRILNTARNTKFDDQYRSKQQ